MVREPVLDARAAELAEVRYLAIVEAANAVVMEATPLPEPKADPKKAAAGGTAFQRKRDAELKASAEKGHNWNALFLRPDAVGDAMAARYGVEKRDILDADADASMAVRLARGRARRTASSSIPCVGSCPLTRPFRENCK